MKTEESADANQREETVVKNKVSRKELFAMIREQIKHEDELVNHRQNWLLLSQAFLFLLFSSLLGLQLSAEATGLPDLTWILPAVACIGVFLNIFSLIGILEAFKSLTKLRKTWYHPYRNEEEFQKHNKEGFPQITWVGTYGALQTATTTPILITAAWGVIVGGVMFSALVFVVLWSLFVLLVIGGMIISLFSL